MTSHNESVDTDWLSRIQWTADGLVPVITQDVRSGRVLTLAWSNREAMRQTLLTGQAHYWSRSRQKLWHKGEESGHIQKLHSIRMDCDGDAVLFLVEQVGGIACHTGREHCFFLELQSGEWVAVDPILKDPAHIYGQGHNA